MCNSCDVPALNYLAITTWDNRIAPVFDVATHCDIFRLEPGAGTVVEQSEDFSAIIGCAGRIQRLQARAVGILICGAITDQALGQARSVGIRVFAFISGDAEAVRGAWLRDGLRDPQLCMPGCGHQRRRRCRWRQDPS